MNRPVYFILLGALAFLILGFYYDKYQSFSESIEDAKPKEKVIKNGPIKVYHANGNLKTIVNYKDGVKDGISYLYYDDGETIQLALPYEDGKRQGTSKKYFKTGDLYAETTYEHNDLHGVRKTYFRSGKTKAEFPYGYGFPGVGVVEYLTNGEKKQMPEITYTQEASIIYLTTSEPCKSAEFHIGSLIEDQYFDELSHDLKLLPRKDGRNYLDLKMFTPSYPDLQDIVCVCKSSRGNTLILKKRINSLSLKKVN